MEDFGQTIEIWTEQQNNSPLGQRSSYSGEGFKAVTAGSRAFVRDYEPDSTITCLLSRSGRIATVTVPYGTS